MTALQIASLANWPAWTTPSVTLTNRFRWRKAYVCNCSWWHLSNKCRRGQKSSGSDLCPLQNQDQHLTHGKGQPLGRPLGWSFSCITLQSCKNWTGKPFTHVYWNTSSFFVWTRTEAAFSPSAMQNKELVNHYFIQQIQNIFDIVAHLKRKGKKRKKGGYGYVYGLTVIISSPVVTQHSETGRCISAGLLPQSWRLQIWLERRRWWRRWGGRRRHWCLPAACSSPPATLTACT